MMVCPEFVLIIGVFPDVKLMGVGLKERHQLVENSVLFI